MVHVLTLSLAGALEARPFEILDRTLSSSDTNALALCARVAAREGWGDVRGDLQVAWRSAQPGPGRRGLERTLVKWDVHSGDQEQVDLALEILVY